MYKDYERAIQKALEHIENHLTAEIDVHALSKQVGYSRFHFQRIFRKVTGRSVSAYVRERRMTESAKTLIRTDIRIIDLAILYHFQSHEAFTRAFKKIYLMTPAQYRRLLRDIYRERNEIVMKKGVPNGWIMTGDSPSNYEAGLDHHTVHSGQRSAYLKSNNSNANGFATLMQHIKAAHYRGERVRFSGFVKTVDVKETAGLWMRVDHSSGEVLAFDNMMNRPIEGTNEWNHYSVVLDVPLKSEAIAFGMLLNGSGQVWIDELCFEVVDESVPVTEQRGPTHLADQPVNLDFESKE